MVRDTDVAVVGGGPVGMLLAAEPALHGVRTTVLERLPVPTGESKAGTLHARTAQTLNRRGLLEAVQPGPHRASAHPHRQVPFHFGGVFGLDLAPVVEEFPAMLGSPQAWRTCRYAGGRRGLDRDGSGARPGRLGAGLVCRRGYGGTFPAAVRRDGAR